MVIINMNTAYFPKFLYINFIFPGKSEMWNIFIG